MLITAQRYYCHHHKFFPDPYSREDPKELSAEISDYVKHMF